MLRDCPVRVLASGDVLLRAGEPCPALFTVLSGRLRMEDPTATVPVTLIRPGDSFGELFLLEQAVVTSTIAAAEPTRLLVIDRDVAWALIRKSHDIARNWLSLFAERSASAASSPAARSHDLHPYTRPHEEITGLFNRRWRTRCCRAELRAAARNRRSDVAG